MIVAYEIAHGCLLLHEEGREEPVVIELTTGSGNFQGSHINARDEQGRTPLVYAIRMRNKSLCELLLDLGAQVVNELGQHGYVDGCDVTDWEGNTPLHHAAKLWLVDICRLLVEGEGASVLVENKWQQTSYQVAEESVAKANDQDFIEFDSDDEDFQEARIEVQKRTLEFLFLHKWIEQSMIHSISSRIR